jgi:uncharacterized protein (DUF2126 family)
MEVTRIAQKPRTTKPYTRAQWAAIDQLGRAVDAKLNAGDVRLTMGGEPTFVSIDDFDGAEWNTEAVGPTSARLPADLVDRLMRRFAPGGVLHFGQGKWYPGESLPRWALNAFWRKDGDAIWANGEYLAREDKDYGYGPADAKRFLDILAGKLGIDPALVRGAFEDPWRYLEMERKLPANVDPRDNKLSDPEERARLAKVFEAGLHSPRRFRFAESAAGMRRSGPVWLSSIWPLRQDYIFLSPGDGPVGYRLPLLSLPWVDEDDYPLYHRAGPVRRQAAAAGQRDGCGAAPEAAEQQSRPSRKPGPASAHRLAAPAEPGTACRNPHRLG